MSDARLRCICPKVIREANPPIGHVCWCPLHWRLPTTDEEDA